jgi:chemotaxis-related protein WspD
VSTSELQLKEPVTPETEACWNDIGVQGNRSCAKLEEVIHCRNCPVYFRAGVHLLDRPLLPEYRRAWTEHYAQKRALATPAKTSALLFRVSTEWLALPTAAFQEVAERRLVHSLPHRRDGVVLGLVNVRGELLLCVSLADLLGLQRSSLRLGQRQVYDRLLVTHWDGRLFVFPAKEVHGVHRFHPTELTEPPATLAKSRFAYTKGILSWQGNTVGLLDADLLFSSLNRSLM